MSKYKASFRIEEEEWKRFKKKCSKLGLNASTVLRILIKEFNEEEKIDVFK
ncbi:MAG: hypothetical protein ACOCV1_04250 [Bacillota bacterium]